MFVVMAGDFPKAIVDTEADAQELVIDLNWEVAYWSFNWTLRNTGVRSVIAMSLADFCTYWYKEVPKI